jgi:hypothetical protein
MEGVRGAIGIPRIPCGIYHKVGRKSVCTLIGVCAVLNQFCRSAVLQRVQAQIRHKQVPPTGYPHLFRFELELASAPRTRGSCILLLMIVRSFFALKSKMKTAS